MFSDGDAVPTGYICRWNIPRRAAGSTLSVPVAVSVHYASGLTDDGRSLGSLSWKIKR
jgi:hypothetical protein